MKPDHITVALSLANLVLLAALAVPRDVATAAADQAVVRARSFELVDPRGVVRSELGIEESGEVVLRLRDGRGNIRVKLGAGDQGSGLLLADETSEVGVHIQSGISGLTRQRSTMITLAEPSGGRRVIRPRPASP